MLNKSLEWKDMTRAFIAAVVVVCAVAAVNAAPQSKKGNGAPRYVVDPFWPKDLPDYWTLGQVAGLLRSWGGPGEGYQWPRNERAIHIDKEGNVWQGGNDKDDQILKFSPEGKFILQVG
jgi:hypothetical protein